MEKQVLKMKKNLRVVSPSELQLQIIKDHQEIEGSENFTFFPESDGKTVIMIQNDTMEISYIKTNANPKDLLKLIEDNNDGMRETYEEIIEQYVQYNDNAICVLDPRSISKLLNLGYTLEYLKNYNLYDNNPYHKYYKITW